MDRITYGNPTIEHKKQIETVSILDNLFDALKNDPFPDNESDLTKEELNEISDQLKTILEPENEAYLNRYKAYDRSLTQSIFSILKRKGIDAEETIRLIDEDITPLVYKLKYFYNRARPYQLANFHKFKLFPFNSVSAHSPSYPSFSSVRAYVILTLIGYKHPTEYLGLKEIIDDIIYSRQYLGLNFPSDNEFSKNIAREILKNSSFTKKHGI